MTQEFPEGLTLYQCAALMVNDIARNDTVHLYGGDDGFVKADIEGLDVWTLPIYVPRWFRMLKETGAWREIHTSEDMDSLFCE